MSEMEVWFRGSRVWPSLGSVVKYLPRALDTFMELAGADPFGLCSLFFLGLVVPICGWRSVPNLPLFPGLDYTLLSLLWPLILFYFFNFDFSR